MIDTRKVAIAPIETVEISAALKNIRPFICASFSDATEGDLRKIALSGHPNLLLKAIVEGVPFGIIHITKGYILRIDVWMSNKESPESWTRAMELAIKKAFAFPETGTIEWRITKSSKDMVKIAESCGFKNQGELQGQGLNREPLVSMGLLREKDIQVQKAAPETSTAAAAELAKKDKVIKELKFKLEQKEGLTKILEANLSHATEKLKEAETQLSLLTKELKKTGGKTDANSAADKIAELETKIKQLEEEKAKLEKSVDDKIKHIANQARIIEDLQKTAGLAEEKEKLLPNETKKTPKPEKEMPEDEDKTAKNVPEAEVETTPPEMPTEQLEALIAKLRLSPIPKKILRAIILQPGIGYKELARKAETSVVYTSIKAGKLAVAGLIVIDHSRRSASLYPRRGIIQKLREELEIDGPKQEPKPADETVETETEKPAEIAKNQQEPESPETKQKEVAEETPSQKKIESPAEFLTPFQKMVQILKELAKNNGSGIETNQLYEIAVGKGLTKDEAIFATKGLRTKEVLTAWSGSTFLQIDKEKLAKI